jgi:hypothetical protein
MTRTLEARDGWPALRALRAGRLPEADPAALDEAKADVRAAYLDHLRGAPHDALTVKLADRVSNVQRPAGEA